MLFIIDSVLCFTIGYLACFHTFKYFMNRESGQAAQINKTNYKGQAVDQNGTSLVEKEKEANEEVQKASIEQANILKEWLMGGDE